MSNPYGITIGTSSASGTFPAAAITDMQNLGIQTLRYQVNWSLVDATGTTNQNTSTYTWNTWDSAVSQCNTAAIDIILTIKGAPSQFKGPAGNPLNPSFTATFASQIATRYNGGAHGTIKGIEVGNEDYNAGADQTSIPVTLVTQLAATMKAVYPAVKAVSSAFTVGVACKLQRNSAGYTAFFDTLLNTSTGPYITGVFQGDYLNFHYYTCLPLSGGNPVSLDPTVDIPSWNGGNGLPSVTHAWQLLDAKRTQYSVTVPVWMTESGFQINTNPGRNSACTLSQATQWQYHQAVLDSLRTSAVVVKWFGFTLGYYDGYGTGTSARDGQSLVQGKLSSPVYTTAYNSLKTYISNNPTWGATPPGPTFTGSPTTLSFASAVGTNPANQTVVLSNTATTSASYTSVSSVSWMTVSPASGSVAANSNVNATLSINTTGLVAGTYTGSLTWTSGTMTVIAAVTLVVSSGPPPPPPPNLIPLTAYFTTAASPITTTANQVYTLLGTPANLNANTTLGTALNWGEVTSQGTSAAWAAATTEPGPSGNGFLWGAKTLENNDLQPGTYTAAVRLNMVGAGAVSITADIHCRLWKWNATTGYNTLIVDCVQAAQTILTTKTVFAPTATTPGVTSFGVGDKLYIEVLVKVLTNTGPAAAQIQFSDLSTDTVTFTGMSTANIATPGYSASPAPGGRVPLGGGTFGVTIGVNPGCGSAGSPYSHWTNLFADMATLGLTWLRFQISWCSIELTQTSPPTYNWAVLDDAVSHCNTAGISIMYTLRGAPTWALTTASQLATTEPFYLPDPTLMAQFATAVATRYNGQNGFGHIDAFAYNEDFCIHHTPVTNALTLNQTLTTAGGPYTSFAINASGFTPNVGTKLYFNGYGSADIAVVSTNVANGDLLVHCNSFTPGVTYNAGTNINIGYVGLNNSKYALFNGLAGITTNNKVESGRDGHFAAAVVKAVTPAIRAAYPGVKIGCPVVWSTQPANPGGIPNTPISIYTAFMQSLYDEGCQGLFDWVDFHYYTSAIDPNVGNNQTSTIAQAMNDLIAVTFANGDTNIPIFCTEFGWQVPTDVSFAVQSTYYQEVLSNVIPPLNPTSNKAMFFTLDYSTTPTQSSIVQWNGSVYVDELAFTTVQTFILGAIVTKPPPATVSLTIGTSPVSIFATSLLAKSKIGRRGELAVTVYDPLGVNHFQQYQQVNLFDQQANLVFSGYITNPIETKPGFGPLLLTQFTATDQHYLADKRVLAKLYRNQTCGFIVQDIVTNILSAEGVTVGQIDAGLTIPIANFGYVTVAQALDALVTSASSSGTPFYWVIDQNQVLWFVAYTDITGPTMDATTIDNGALSSFIPQVTRANPLYRNTQYVVGGFQEAGTHDETRAGDGQTRAFTFSYPLNAAPTTFTLNGSNVTIALLGTSGAQYYWAQGSQVITQDSSQTILVSTDRLRAVYVGQVPAVFTGQHADQVTFMANLDGTSGIVEAVITDTTVTSFNQGMSEVGQALQRYCVQGLQFQFATRQAGLAPGQLITVNYAPYGFSGAQMLIEEVDFSDQVDGFTIWYIVTAVQGPYDTYWTDFFGNLFNKGGIALSINVGVAIVQPLYPSTTLLPSPTLYPS